MTRFEFMKTLNLEQMQMFLYFNKPHTRLGMKRILEWLDGEIEQKEVDLVKEYE